MNMTTIKNQKGFSMLEGVFTTMLLAVGLVGGMAVMQNATATTLNGDMNSTAVQLANEKIEEIMGDNEFQGYDNITDENYDAETLSAPYQGFSRSVNVTEVDSDDLTTEEVGSGLKKVDVTVSWGSDDSVMVTTIVADYE
jgi:Tfp pilus assembly protein PilV